MSEIVRVRPLLGTFVTVRARGGPRDILTSAVDRAFARVAHVQAVMSFHDSASELSLLNREAARRPVAVSPDTLAVLRLAREIYLASDGLFDSAIAPHLVEWGYLPRGSRGGADLPPSPQATARQVHGPRTRARHRATLADLIIDHTARVRFGRPMQLDLGGIAKGYAVDCAIDALRSAGVPSGSVNAGGDLRVFGDDSVRVHVRDPRHPAACMPLADIRDAAVATSATYFSRRHLSGHAVSAIVDPHRCEPCRRRASVSVIAPRCAVADALTKIVLLDEQRATSVLRQCAASAVVITASGRVRTVGSHAA